MSATNAKRALRDWARANIPDEKRAEHSKLVAAYVAESIREYRQRSATAASLSLSALIGGDPRKPIFERVFGK